MASIDGPTTVPNREPYQSLLDELLGESTIADLRLAFIYGTDSVDVAYLREDLLGEDMQSRVEELHARAKHIEFMPTSELQAVYGEVEMAVMVREEAVELYFLGGDGEGLVATADRTENVLVQLLQL